MSEPELESASERPGSPALGLPCSGAELDVVAAVDVVVADAPEEKEEAGRDSGDSGAVAASIRAGSGTAGTLLDAASCTGSQRAYKGLPSAGIPGEGLSTNDGVSLCFQEKDYTGVLER